MDFGAVWMKVGKMFISRTSCKKTVQNVYPPIFDHKASEHRWRWREHQMGMRSHNSTAASPAVKPSVFSSCRWLQLINTCLSSTSATQWWTLNECQQHTVKESSEPYKTEKAKIKSRVRILSWLKDRIVLVIKLWLMERPSFSCSQKLWQTLEWTVEVELLEVKHFVK